MLDQVRVLTLQFVLAGAVRAAPLAGPAGRDPERHQEQPGGPLPGPGNLLWSAEETQRQRHSQLLPW